MFVSRRPVLVGRTPLIVLSVLAGGSLLVTMFLLGRSSVLLKTLSVSTGSNLNRNGSIPSSTVQGKPGERGDGLEVQHADILEEVDRSAKSTQVEAGMMGKDTKMVEDGAIAVQRYFQDIDRIQLSSGSGDMKGFAQDVVTGLVKGDSSGLEDTIRQTQENRRRLASITPPAPCARHYRESCEAMDQGLKMMQVIRDVLDSKGGVDQLEGLTSSAKSIQAKAEVIKQEEAALRARYALNP